MSEVFILARQVLIMFALISVGYLLSRVNKLSDETARQIADFILYICSPALMILSFNIPFSWTKLEEMGWTIFLSILAMLVAIFISEIILKKHFLERFGAIFSNTGFMGIPLVRSLLGDGAVYYLTIYMIVVSVFVWTYGIYLITKDKQAMSVKKMLFNPTSIAFAIGFVLLVSPIKLPGMAVTTLKLLGDCNTPLGMLILGKYLSKSKLSEIFTLVSGWRVSFVRLLLIPGATIVAFHVLGFKGDPITMTILIAGATPSATVLAIFSQLHGQDYTYGAKVISLTTLLSLVTMPFMIYLTTIL